MSLDPWLQRAGRRRFLRLLALLGVGGPAWLRARDASADVAVPRDALRAVSEAPSKRPELPRRRLGRTGFEASRLVFGCGATLSRERKDDLLEAAFDAGINVFDVGTRRYYRDAEANLAPFLERRRDRLFLISKAMVYLDVGPSETISAAQGREAARTWTGLLDQSLVELGVDHVDAYYVMASHNPSIVASEEMGRAFEAAKAAGKTRHVGLSTHQNAQRVLETAMETGWYDLAQIAITPAGWYDWESKGILRDTRSLAELRPFLDRVCASGIGLIGMKAGRHLAGRKFLAWGRPGAFDAFYDERMLASGLSPFQRSYAWVLAHGLDAVNADMQSFPHLRENLVAAIRASRDLA